MGFLFAFIAVFCESLGKTVDKVNFRKNHITYRQNLLLCFFGMTALLLAFILLTKQAFPHFTPIALGLTVLIALFSFGGNVFDEMSLKADDLSLREPLVDFQPILAGLVGYTLFPSERKPIFLLAFVLGALVVYWGTHRRKLRRLQKKGMTYLLLAAAFYAFLPSIYKLALAYMSPVYISFFRASSILVLLAIFLPVRKVSKLSPAKIRYSFSAATIYAFEAVISIYAIKSLGVVFTMVLLMTGPAMRYWSSSFILKEKVRAGEMASSFLLAIIVLVSVLKP
jgi:drug/metabolite transporter (DMT)-like permease